MVDNWSSPVTLTDPGDWAKWTITLDTHGAEVMNGLHAGDLPPSTPFMVMRHALGGPNLQGTFLCSVNDLVGWGGGPADNLFSDNDWTSAGRFTQSGQIGGVVVGDAATAGIFTVVDAEPWVAGDNVFRFIWLGEWSGLTPLALEIDNIFLEYDGSVGAGNPDFSGFDYAIESPPSDYATHVNPNPTLANASPRSVYFLKAPEATTGHADLISLSITKLCPGNDYRVKVHADLTGTPIVGLTIYQLNEDGLIADSQITNSRGDASFETPIRAKFFWPGSDDLAPAIGTADYDEFFGCGGWHVGRIAI